MKTHYVFCPKCDERIDTTLRAIKDGSLCTECGEKFWPEKLKRIDDTARGLVFAGAIVCIVGLAGGFVALAQKDDKVSGIIAASSFLSIGMFLCLIGLLQHIRTALEKK